MQSLDARDDSRTVFAEYHGHGTRASSFMVRQGDWKLIHNIAAPDQLFNLTDDPEELTNLNDSKPAKAAEMSDEMNKICDPLAEQHRAEAFWQMQVAMNDRK